MVYCSVVEKAYYYMPFQGKRGGFCTFPEIPGRRTYLRVYTKTIFFLLIMTLTMS